jgi:hypothetical protein
MDGAIVDAGSLWPRASSLAPKRHALGQRHQAMSYLLFTSLGSYLNVPNATMEVMLLQLL